MYFFCCCFSIFSKVAKNGLRKQTFSHITLYMYVHNKYFLLYCKMSDSLTPVIMDKKTLLLDY